MSPPFRISIVPGVTPGKWARIWEERMPRVRLTVTLVEDGAQLELLRGGEVEMGFVRLPVDRQGLHLIPLYSAVPVAVVAREHQNAERESLTLSEVSEELLDLPGLTVKEAIEVVGGGVGVVVVPMSVARLYHRKDVVAVPVADAPRTQVALAWPEGTEDPRVEEFIGVVRGRTERSSRGSAAAEGPPARKKRADEKAAARTSRNQQPKAGARKPVRARPARRRS